MMLPKTIGNLKLVTSYYTFVSGKSSPRDTLASLSLVRYVTQLEVTYKNVYTSSGSAPPVCK